MGITQYVFIDESGNYKFTPKSNKNLYFTAVITSDPKPLSQKLRTLKYSYLKDGRNIEYSMQKMITNLFVEKFFLNLQQETLKYTVFITKKTKFPRVIEVQNTSI